MARPAALARYAAFLRGVSPMNARMPDLAAAFEAAGFADVRTLLSSGNVVFSARRAPLAALERRAEAAMEARLGKAFPTIVREVAALRRLLDGDPYAAFRLPPARSASSPSCAGRRRRRPRCPSRRTVRASCASTIARSSAPTSRGRAARSS